MFGEMVNEELSEPGFRTPANAQAVSVLGGCRIDISRFPGKLVVLEGTDGAGRSTHVALLREHLEVRGFGVMNTGLSRGRLAGDGLRKAKLGTTAGQRTLDLFYATDFADRLENEILPALRAGFVVLTDRYIYSLMARSAVRGTDRSWLEDLFQFAPTPHGVMYLKVDVEHLIPRVITRGNLDYWESGMDFQEESDVFQSFARYQSRLLETLDGMAADYGFRTINANRPVDQTFSDVRDAVDQLVGDMQGTF